MCLFSNRLYGHPTLSSCQDPLRKAETPKAGKHSPCSRDGCEDASAARRRWASRWARRAPRRPVRSSPCLRFPGCWFFQHTSSETTTCKHLARTFLQQACDFARKLDPGSPSQHILWSQCQHPPMHGIRNYAELVVASTITKHRLKPKPKP